MDRGLALVDAPVGTLIIYATSPGNVSEDGDGRNGIFTEALLKHINTPGLEVELMLKEVRREVQVATDGNQVPWTNSSLTGSFYFYPVEIE